MSRVAFVTGANTGIGYEVVRALARQGMTVYLGSRDAAKGAAAVSALSAEGDVRLIVIDLTRPETIRDAVEVIDREHGKLDVLVNNAGVSHAGNVLTVDTETIDESFAANLHGPMELARLAMPLIRKGEKQRIVNVSTGASLPAFLADPGKFARLDQLPYAYCASKAALNAATLMLAGMLKEEGIKVNAANPGHVKSQVSRFLGTKSPEDGARIIVQLATLDDDGPTGGFFDDRRQVPW